MTDGARLERGLEVATPATREYRVDVGQVRLDVYLAQKRSDLTRARLQKLIGEGYVSLNGSPARASQKVRTGDRVLLTVPPPRPTDLTPQQIPLNLVYEDENVAVVDKPAGLPVHPGPGHPDGTLVNGLLALCPDIQGIGGDIRPGIVHRLDKDTSGLMAVAKTHAAHQSLSGQLKSRRVAKGYLALATGQVAPAEGLIDAPIARDIRNRKRMAVAAGGRDARTRYRTLLAIPPHTAIPAGEVQLARRAGPVPRENPSGHTLLDLLLETGRTHQIRVHLAYLGHPLLGDDTYGRASPLLARQFLHAHHLGFEHPNSGEWMDFHSVLPTDLAAVLEYLGAQTPG